MLRTTHIVGSCLALACSVAAQSLIANGSVPAGYYGQAGDVDGDGRLDYITASATQFTVHSGATGAMLPLLTQPVATGTDVVGYVAVGDVDADGNDDLAYYQSSLLGANFVTIVDGGDGTTLHSWNLPAPWAPETLVAGGADYDADGFSDVLVGYRTPLDCVLLVHSGRDGTLLLQQVHPATFVTFHSIGPLGDIDGDGYDDVGVYRQVLSQTTLTAHLGPDFVDTQYVGTDVVVVGDTNGNGTTDFFDQVPPFFTIVDGNGVTLWTYFQAGFLEAWRVDDMDGDGGAEVVLRNVGVASWVMSGRTLATLPGVAPGSTYALGDIDGDGRSEAGRGFAIYQWYDPALPVASRMVRRGVAGTTSTGRRPRIKTRGHTSLGHEVFFDVRGAMPNGVTFLAVGPATDLDLGPVGAPGNRAFADLQGGWLLPADANGLASYRLTMPTTMALIGAAATVQCVVLDPAANALGVVTSDACDIETHN